MPSLIVGHPGSCRCVRCERLRRGLPELSARLERDGWWVTVRTNGQTRSPEGMVRYLVALGVSEPDAADHVAAAIAICRSIGVMPDEYWADLCECEYCHRQFWTDSVHQADLPFPEHVTCSDVCSIIMGCRKPVAA